MKSPPWACVPKPPSSPLSVVRLSGISFQAYFMNIYENINIYCLSLGWIIVYRTHYSHLVFSFYPQWFLKILLYQLIKNISILFWGLDYFIVWLYLPLVSQSTERHLGCFPSSALASTVAINILVYVALHMIKHNCRLNI